MIFVIQTPSVLRLHLTCVSVTQPAATGVNVIMDTSVMGLIAQVSYMHNYSCNWAVDDICLFIIMLPRSVSFVATSEFDCNNSISRPMGIDSEDKANNFSIKATTKDVTFTNKDSNMIGANVNNKSHQ